MILKFKAKEKAVWVGDFTEIAGLDPAFEGGDRCILRIGRAGEIDGGGWAFDPSHAIIPIKVDVTSQEPLHYQIVRQVKHELESRDIKREHFGLDTTGEGGGLASIFVREWGPGFLEVEFGGRASEDPVSENDPKPASKEYLYKVTQLWFNFRSFVQNGQVRGLDDETAVEFCKRFYEMVGNLIKVESKEQMKMRTGRSPDLADATVVMSEVVRLRIRQFSAVRAGRAKTKTNWKEAVLKHRRARSSYAPQLQIR